MRYFPKRARKKQDISLLLLVCPSCLGDLVPRSNSAGRFYLCIQCNETVETPGARSRQPAQKIATLPAEFFPDAEPSLT
jgi:hypothetical protein